jgi:hypothetical protein
VTANDVRALAVSGLDHPVLAVVGDDLVLIPEAELPAGARVLVTQEDLLVELGREVSDFEAEIFAGRLTADQVPGEEVPPTA